MKNVEEGNVDTTEMDGWRRDVYVTSMRWVRVGTRGCERGAVRVGFMIFVGYRKGEGDGVKEEGDGICTLTL